jgi:hypothetical protein
MTGITTVFCANGVPAEALAWDAPGIVDDDGSATWYFEGIGLNFEAEILGYDLEGFATVPEGLDVQVTDLKPLPEILKREIESLRAQGEGV